MLRRTVGEEAFMEGMRAYYQHYKHKTVVTADFQRAMQDAYGGDLSAFFEQWAYLPGNPSLQGFWQYDEKARSVTVMVRQVQDTKSHFVIPLDIDIYHGDSASQIFTVQMENREQRYTIPLETAPLNVRLDPETWLLFEENFRAK